jgi:hypothetical protein
MSMDGVKGRKGPLADLAEWMLLAVLVGILDYATGPFISLTLFYLVPVAGAAWFAGQRAGFIVAVTAAASAVISDTLNESPLPSGTFVWNSLSRLLVLTIAAVVVSRLRVERDRLERLDSERSHSLALLDRGLAEPARQILELLEHWNGGIEELRTMLRPRAETIAFLARDFADIVRLQRGQIPLHRSEIDLVALVEELRAERKGALQFLMPTEPMRVYADRARMRQGLDALLALVGRTDEGSLSIARQANAAEVVISANDVRQRGERPEEDPEKVALTVELARQLFAPQGGTLDVSHNPLTRSLRVTARFPLA